MQMEWFIPESGSEVNNMVSEGINEISEHDNEQEDTALYNGEAGSAERRRGQILLPRYAEFKILV